MMVSGNYFHVLGVEPRLGRGFRDDEDQVPGRDAVVVLGPDFWKHEFASDPSVVGRTIRLNGTDFTVIGVAPDTFPGMQIFANPDFYMPLAMARVFSTNPQKNFFEDRDDRELSVKARLKPGTTLQQAQSELAVLAQNFERDYPQLNRNRGAAVRTQFEMLTRNDDRCESLEVHRDLCDPRAGGAAGGVHQRCGTSFEPCPHANPRNRRAVGDGRRAFPADPAAVDGKPDSRVPGWIGRGRRRVRRHKFLQTLQNSNRVAGHDPVPDGYARAAGKPRVVRS